MEKAAATCAIAGVLQPTIGFVGAAPCIVSGIVTLLFAGLLGVMASMQKR